MSDEVRSNSVPAPAAEDPSGEAVDGPKAEQGGAPPVEADTDTSDTIPAPDPPISISIEFDLEPPSTEPVEVEGLTFPAEAHPEAPAHAPSDASGPLLPLLTSEVSPTRSDRPPPPSQRGSGYSTLRVGAAAAPARPLPAATPREAMPPPALAAEGALDARRPLSEPVPLVVRAHAPHQPRGSSLPPGLVEPKRIIEVLGSNVPVLDSAWQEEVIEDLDANEAHELSETPVPDSVSPPSEPELELNVVVDEFGLDEAAAEAAAGDAEAAGAAGVDATSQEASARDATSPTTSSFESTSGAGLARLDEMLPDDSSTDFRTKAPPNKRRRPPPPSTRLSERAKTEPSLLGRKWWEEMFSEEFLRAIPILSPRQLEREVNFIDEGLGVARGGRILDLACGAGQHAVELAGRGYDLVGYDLSQSQLDWAGGLAQERGQRLQFTHGDMRDLTYSESFDAVYSWNTSFGFFEEDKNFDVAQRVFKALRPGGRFLLDVVNRDFVVAQQPGQTWFEGDGCVCIDDVSIDFITSRMKCKRTLMLTTGKNRECSYSLRIYCLHELGKLLHDVGFKVLTVSGRPEMPGVFFGHASPRIIILAAKPAGGPLG